MHLVSVISIYLSTYLPISLSIHLYAHACIYGGMWKDACAYIHAYVSYVRMIVSVYVLHSIFCAILP